MSLFDIIRYQNANLESFDELISMPEELIKLYWTEASDRHDDYVREETHTEACRMLAIWASARHRPTVTNNEVIQRCFTRALKKYNT